MKKLKQEAELKNKKKTSLLMVVVVLVLVFVATLRIIVANQLVAISDKLAKLDRKTSDLVLLNEQNSRLLSGLQSSNSLKQSALKMGYVPVERNLIFVQKNNLASILP